MKKNKGFTLIELMIVIAIIAIIAAIAIPNLMQSRIRANEATAVTVIKAYGTAQVTFQLGRNGALAVNTTHQDRNGFCDNYRNLFYGNPTNSTTAVLALISQAHADAYADPAQVNDNSTATNGTMTVTANPAVYQGYYFASPTTDVNGPFNFRSDYAQMAFPASGESTGTNLYWCGQQGSVYFVPVRSTDTTGGAAGTLLGDLATSPSVGLATASSVTGATWASF